MCSSSYSFCLPNRRVGRGSNCCFLEREQGNCCQASQTMAGNLKLSFVLLFFFSPGGVTENDSLGHNSQPKSSIYLCQSPYTEEPWGGGKPNSKLTLYF